MSRRYLRPETLAGHVLVLIAVLVCLRLGWWQWNVAHETRGTIQNLGYALLWPVFGGAFIFMWLRFLYLEDERRAQQPEVADLSDLLDAANEGSAADATLADATLAGSTGVEDRVDSDPLGLLPARPDPLDGSPIEENPTGPSDPGPVDRPPGAEATALDSTAEAAGDPGGADIPETSVAEPRRGRRPRAPSTAVTIAVATVGGDDDDEELAAYNRALARLAEQDNRRAR